MQPTNTLFGLTAIAVATVTAQAGSTIKINVGKDGLLQYSPDNLVVEVGTQVEFDFFPKNHTVTQSSFANPCHPLANGFFSGFNPTTAASGGNSFTVTVNDTKPIWFYCGQTVGNHCQAGMVGAINAPTSGNTFDKFAALAKNATTSTSPPGGAVGGILKVNSNSISSSSSSSSSETSASGSAYTTKAYASTYTSNSAVYTVTATTTLFTVAPASTTGSSSSGSSTSSPSPSSSAASTGAASGLESFCVGAVILAAAAMLY